MTTHILLLVAIPPISELINKFQNLDIALQIAIGIAAFTAIATIISTLLPGLFSILWKIISFPFKKRASAPPLPEAQTINNYYGTDPAQVDKLTKELSLRDDVAKRLLKNLNEKEVALNERTKAFEEEAKKYQALRNNVREEAKHNVLAKQAEEQLEKANWDEAEKLLEQANQEEQKHLSKHQETIASRTFGLAQISELKLDYQKAILRYQEVTQLDPQNLSAWQQLAELSSKIGESQDALRAWQQLQHHAEQQEKSRWQMIAQVGEADILAKHGYRSLALDKYQQAHQWFLQQLKGDPNNSDWQRDLSVSYDNLGNMHKTNGDGDNAISAYNNSLNIRETLAKRDPNNSDWQRDLSVSYDNLGNMHKANGDGDNAISAYNKSLNIREALAKRDPNNSDWQFDLGIAYERIGNMHSTNGKINKALENYLQRHEIITTLSKRDPNNSDWQRDLMVSYVKFSDVFPKKRKKHLQKGLDILLTLKNEKRLYKEDFWIIDELKKRLAK